MMCINRDYVQQTSTVDPLLRYRQGIAIALTFRFRVS
jgi:hypothetical protein